MIGSGITYFLRLRTSIMRQFANCLVLPLGNVLPCLSPDNICKVVPQQLNPEPNKMNLAINLQWRYVQAR